MSVATKVVVGMKIPRLNGRDGSSPSPGTILFNQFSPKLIISY
ncbi:MAG: hypothetical protein ACI9SC_003241 [Gammaproteobacteria bacterium]|jgi:hypothetical protein